MELRENLKKLTIAELEDVLASHGVFDCEKKKKSELIEKLAEIMLDKDVIIQKYVALKDNEIEELLRMHKFGGVEMRIDSFPHEFLFSGYLYMDNDKKKIRWCSDALEVFLEVLNDLETKKFRKLARKVMAYGNAFSTLYGLIPLEKAFEIYKGQNNDLEEDDFYELLDFITTLATWEIVDDKIVAEHILFEDEMDLIERIHADKPYYIPSKTEILRYEDEYYIDRTKEFLAVKRFFQKVLGYDEEYADDIAGDIQLEFSLNSEISTIFSSFCMRDVVFDNDEQAERLVKLCVELSDNTRRYTERGMTPREVRFHAKKMKAENNSAKSVKVGRNEPCPCGSGKKYKKCCGM